MENKFDYIENYFHNRLSDSERADFEKKRSEDKEFDLMVKTYRNAAEIIGEKARERMKVNLDAIGKQQMSTDVVTTFIRYRFVRKHWLSLAASVVLISAAAYFALNRVISQSDNGTPSSLFADNFNKPGIDLVINRGSVKDTNEILWIKALELYNNSDYRSAADQFDQLLKNPGFGLKSAAGFFSGISYMLMENHDSASVRFLNVSVSSSFYYESEWYLALNSLKAGNISDATGTLTKIKEDRQHPRQEEASRLLKKLQKPGNRSEDE